MKRIILILILVLTVGCLYYFWANIISFTNTGSFKIISTENGVGEKEIGMANPAAVYCSEQAGHYEMDTEDCVWYMADGSTELDRQPSWDYFRKYHSSNSDSNNFDKTDENGQSFFQLNQKYNNVTEFFADDFITERFGGDYGLKIILTPKWYEGSNLSSDSYLKVQIYEMDYLLNEQGGAAECQPGIFSSLTVQAGIAIEDEENDIRHIYFTDAGAGNYYEINLYAKQLGDFCVGIEELVHSTNISNYPEGTVLLFDQQSLFKSFAEIRRIIFE